MLFIQDQPDLASAIDPGRPVAKFAEVCDLPPGGEAGGAQHLEEGGRGRGVCAAVGGGGGRQGGGGNHNHI